MVPVIFCQVGSINKNPYDSVQFLFESSNPLLEAIGTMLAILVLFFLYLLPLPGQAHYI